MAKNFFKQYLMLKAELTRNDFLYDNLNKRCFSEIDKYLYSCKWCNTTTEKLIFHSAMQGIAPNDMEIKVNGKVLKPESVRSAMSRISKRLYSFLGYDLSDVLLGSPQDKYVKTRLNTIIGICMQETDGYVFQNDFSCTLVDMIQDYCKEYMNVEVPKHLQKSEGFLKVLTFFSQYNNENIKNQLYALDAKSVALIYKILTEKQYSIQRASVLAYLKSHGVLTSSKIKVILDEEYEAEIQALKLQLLKKDEEIAKLKRK